jgi:L-ascorbate metabolism protein UlaG (beta-lactamase superfamily)
MPSHHSIVLAAFLGALPLWSAPSSAGELSGDKIPGPKGDLIVHPINHATLAVQWSGKTTYVDPVGGAARFKGLPEPDLILLTDNHGDHLDRSTLEGIAKPGTKFVAPSAVVEILPSELRQKTTVLNNGQSGEVAGIQIQAVAAYNTTAERQKFHAKDRGNGYVLNLGGQHVYISGDTEETPEMDALKNIDVAFICMNLPYTMDVEQAAKAVEAFKPRIVYPYHYRGSDLEKFKSLVGPNAGVEVRIRDWYTSR